MNKNKFFIFIVLFTIFLTVPVFAGSRSYYIYDRPARSIVSLIDSSGEVKNSYDYDAFGNISNKTESINNNFKYTGEQYDNETGLIFLRNRYYDPEIGRFITKDPLLDADRVLWYLK